VDGVIKNNSFLNNVPTKAKAGKEVSLMVFSHIINNSTEYKNNCYQFNLKTVLMYYSLVWLKYFFQKKNSFFLIKYIEKFLID
jgi:hypothetical protein